MSFRLRSLLAFVGALMLVVAAFLYFARPQPTTISTTPVATTSEQTSLPTAPTKATSTVENASVAQKTTAKSEISRIENPYSSPPLSPVTVSQLARGALVNILCQPRAGGSLAPISGSGVIIDPRGVILTNAHVGQYVLLSKDPQIDLQCVIRTGSPALARYSAEVLYIPPVWIEQHAADIKKSQPLSTGEHDYALLRITGSLNGPVPFPFPYLSIDTREAIGFQGDQVAVASYPLEFAGGLAAQNLYSVSSQTTIGQLMTFSAGSVDLISLGGVIEAQRGSSGGAVVNAWGRLVALIATTSEGPTTSARDLRAITLSYINKDMAQSARSLTDMLNGDIAAEAANFNTYTAPRLLDLYLAQLAH